MTETTKYNRTAVFVAACIGICFFGVSMITLGAVLPELCEALSLSEADATGLTTLLPAGLLAGSLLFGPIVDRFGHKPVLVTCCLLVDAALLAVALGRDAAMLRWAIFAIGLGGGALNGETNAMVTEIYEGARRASRLSLLGVFYGIGALAIPLLLAWLSRSYDYNTVLTGISAVLALGIVFCAVTRFPGAKQPQGFPLREAGKIITHPIMLVVALLLFFQSGVEGITNNWSLMYLDSLGIGITDGRLALTAMLAGLTAARLVQSFLFSRVEPMRVLLASLLLTACGFAGLAVATGVWAAVISMAVIGAGLASTFPVMFGVLGERFPALSGTAFSVALTVALCGQTALNYTVGAVADKQGIGCFPPLAILAVGAMLVLFAAVRILSRRKTAPQA
mgnify:CR=1 FL=1